MVSLGEVPEVVYTNEQIINSLFSYLNEGQINEVVERSLDADTSDKGGGIKKIISLKYAKTSTDEEETELVRKLDSIGKFAILHGHLEEEEDITNLSEISESDRDDIENNEFVEATGKITQSPINELQELIQQFQPYLDMFNMDPQFEEDGQEFSMGDIQSFLNELDSGQDLFRVSTESDSDLVFSMDEGALSGQLSEYAEYHVLGRVEHVYEQGEEDWLLNVMDMMPGNDRESRMQRRKFLKQMADGASEVLNRNVTEDDFKIAHPDIRVRPVAIYLS